MKTVIKTLLFIGKSIDDIRLLVCCYWIAKKVQTMKGSEIHSLTDGERRVLRLMLDTGLYN